MNNKNILMLKSAMQKEAMMAAAGRGLMNFGRGLVAPAMKAFGGLQKHYGLAQQALGTRSGSKALIDAGTKNFRAGSGLRRTYGFRNMTKQGPWTQRAGRLVGGATLGYGTIMAPATAAEYAGAMSVDPNTVRSHAMASAQDRIAHRMQEFQNLSFSDRMRAAHDPQAYTSNILQNSREFNDLYTNNQNPGMLGYASPFVIGAFAGNPLKNKVNYEILNSMNKQANLGSFAARYVPKTYSFFNRVIAPSWNAAGKGQSAIAARRTIAKQFTNPIDRLAARTTINIRKNPFTTAFGLATPLLAANVITPYYQGKSNVYDQAASGAAGLADAQFADQFSNANSFMRYGAAVMPGMASNFVNTQVAQAMAPHSGFYGSRQPFNPYASANVGNSYGPPSYQLGNQ